MLLGSMVYFPLSQEPENWSLQFYVWNEKMQLAVTCAALQMLAMKSYILHLNDGFLLLICEAGQEKKFMQVLLRIVLL